ncbi:MAG: hypothetical protein EPN72_02665 [Nevskiaceae bacterium]|nr:MAG: hypothetical protein EPN63_11295 [Nevskiaceae bacterium]TBR74459.1 MAG: hypothetical protein EPN72_02665 [Nevskiaceae bacterium]
MKFPSTVVAATLLLGAALGAPAATPTPNIVVHENVQIQHFYGYAYDLENGKYRYTEVHERQVGSDGMLGESTHYYAPDGTLIATRMVDFSGDPFLPRFRLDQLDTPRSVGITKLTPQHIDAFRQSPKDKTPERQTLQHTAGAVALAGLDNFIRAHFAELQNGKPVSVPLFSAETFDTRTATISRLKNGVLDHHATVRFKVVSSSWLRLVKGQPILLSYDAASQRLVEYRGMSELDAPHTHKPYTVRVSYARTPPADAPAKLPPLEAADAP